MQRCQVEVRHLWPELGLEVSGRAAGHRPELAQHAYGVRGRLRQPVGAEDDKPDDAEHDQLGPADVVEHQSLRTEASTTVAVRRCPARTYVIVTRSPGACLRMSAISSSAEVMVRPSTATTTSPGCSPAFAAGPAGSTALLPAAICAPTPAKPPLMCTPMTACVAKPCAMICDAIR